MSWDKLSMAGKASYIKLGVQNGITSLDNIRGAYNSYASGGHIYDGDSEPTQFMSRAVASDNTNVAAPPPLVLKTFTEEEVKAMKEEEARRVQAEIDEKKPRAYINDKGYYVDQFGKIIHKKDIDRCYKLKVKYKDRSKYNRYGTKKSQVSDFHPADRNDARRMNVEEADRHVAENYNAETILGAAASGLNVLSPSQQFGAIVDWAQGEKGYWEGIGGGNSGFFTDEFAKNNPEEALIGNIVAEIALGAGTSKLTPLVSNTINQIYESGTLYDKYTTIGGRFGYYGNNWFDRVKGTLGRRLNLPTKESHPELLRKIKPSNLDDPIRYGDQGELILTGDRNGITNYTIDRPVASHSSGNWDSGTLIIQDPKTIAGKIPESIEPSDFFFTNGLTFNAKPGQATIISGNIKTLKTAASRGYDTASSPRLRRLWDEMSKQYTERMALESQVSPVKGINLGKTRETIDNFDLAINSDLAKKYALEIQRLQARRGTPSMKDINFIEGLYNKSSGVVPYNNQIQEIESIFRRATALPISQLHGLTYKFPNGRESKVSDWLLTKLGKSTDYTTATSMPWNKLFYDPSTHAEVNYRLANGIK